MTDMWNTNPGWCCSGLELSVGTQTFRVCMVLSSDAHTHTNAFASFPETSLLNRVIGVTIKVVFNEVKPC